MNCNNNKSKIHVYCVFEGGGAKGIGHVGVLNALEDLSDDIQIVGYAGTSAGAIIASLAAAGYSSKEIFSCENEVETEKWEDYRLVFCDPGENPKTKVREILGTGWKKLKIISWILNNWLEIFLFYLFVIFTISLSNSIDINYLFLKLLRSSFIIISVFILFTFTLSLFSFRGFVSTRNLCNLIDQRISEKIPNKNKGVKFKDLQIKKNLKIVATNLQERKMVLFSKDTTPDVEIADAVAASAALPIVFAPKSIRKHDNAKTHQYSDGGLVSNLPAWTFDGESMHDEVIIVTTQFLDSYEKEEKAAENFLKGLGLLSNLARSSVFGASDLNTRGLKNHVNIELRSNKINVVDFEKPLNEFYQFRQDYYRTAKIRLMQILFCRDLVTELFDVLNKKYSTEGGDINVSLVRPILLQGAKISGYHLWGRCIPNKGNWSECSAPLGVQPLKDVFDYEIDTNDHACKTSRPWAIDYFYSYASKNGTNTVDKKSFESDWQKLHLPKSKWMLVSSFKQPEPNFHLNLAEAVLIDGTTEPENFDLLVEDIGSLIKWTFEKTLLKFKGLIDEV